MTKIKNNGSIETCPSFIKSMKVFAKIGLLSFGGPTAQIALMHKELVETNNWLNESKFLSALSFCMFLPGPEAMQLATYAGWRLHGVRGGLFAGLLFILPGSILVLILASIYAYFGEISEIQAIFIGIKATVIVIVIEALIKVSKRALKETHHCLLAFISFIAFFFFSVPFPLIIISAGIIGFLMFSIDNKETDISLSSGTTSLKKTLFTTIVWLSIWLIPLATMIVALGDKNIFVQLGLFFSKLAVVSFGGAYSVLAYMTQEVVENYKWVTASEMLDGLGLAETTNGPLILVNEFIGYLAAYRLGGGFPLISGLTGAIVTLWVTFTPCFLWIFVGAPYIDSIQKNPRLNGALSGITAAVVGVILNLTVWFGLHVFFEKVNKTAFGPLTIWIPELSTFHLPSVLFAGLAAFLLTRLRIGLAKTIFLTGIIAFIWNLIVGST